jgi:dTMP kinase
MIHYDENDILKLIQQHRYIAVEGINGAGKTTFIEKILLPLIREQEIDFVYTSEPRGTEAGRKNYKTILEKTDNNEKQKLFHESRLDIQQKWVSPALKNNTLVITDRSIYSGYHYSKMKLKDFEEKYIDGVIFPTAVIFIEADKSLFDNKKITFRDKDDLDRMENFLTQRQFKVDIFKLNQAVTMLKLKRILGVCHSPK